MMRNILFFGVILLLASSAIFMAGCDGEKPAEEKAPAEVTNGDEAVTEAEGTTETVAAMQYVCPMGCTDDVFDTPDHECPKCGMTCDKEYHAGEDIHMDDDDMDDDDDDDMDDDDDDNGHE